MVKIAFLGDEKYPPPEAMGSFSPRLGLLSCNHNTPDNPYVNLLVISPARVRLINHKAHQTVRTDEMIDSRSLKKGTTSAMMKPNVQITPSIAHQMSHVAMLELVKRGDVLNIVTKTSTKRCSFRRNRTHGNVDK